MIVFPELGGNRYTWDKSVWDNAQTLSGPLCTLLSQLAIEHGVYIGITFLEVDDNADYYNTFVLFGPTRIEDNGIGIGNGTNLLGLCRKMFPAGPERCFMIGERPQMTNRNGSFSHVIDTALGRLGVLICYESIRMDAIEQLQRHTPQLVLLLYSAPGQDQSFADLVGTDVEAYNFTMDEVAVSHSRLMGVPVVSVNMCGNYTSSFPAATSRIYNTQFSRITKIIDNEGNVIATTQHMPLPLTHTILTADIIIPDPTHTPRHPFLSDNIPLLLSPSHPMYTRVQNLFVRIRQGMAIWEVYYGPLYYALHCVRRERAAVALGLVNATVKDCVGWQVGMAAVVCVTFVGTLRGWFGQ